MEFHSYCWLWVCTSETPSGIFSDIKMWIPLCMRDVATFLSIGTVYFKMFFSIVCSYTKWIMNVRVWTTSNKAVHFYTWNLYYLSWMNFIIYGGSHCGCPHFSSCEEQDTSVSFPCETLILMRRTLMGTRTNLASCANRMHTWAPRKGVVMIQISLDRNSLWSMLSLQKVKQDMILFIS